MRALDASFWSDINLLVSSGAAIWLVAIEAAPGSAFYLADNPEAITHGGVDWMPYPLKVGAITDSGDGDQRQLTLTLSNVHRMLMPYLAEGSWKNGRVTLLLAWSADPATDTGFRLDFRMQSITARAGSVAIALGQPNYLDRQFPGERYIRGERFKAIPRAPS